MHCHIPLTTHPKAVMGIAGAETHMLAGNLYEMDETQRHYVRNGSGVNRVHLLFAWFPHGGKGD